LTSPARSLGGRPWRGRFESLCLLTICFQPCIHDAASYEAR
jgi:hypothetical protein